jgi:hypothetical protein
MNKGSTLLSITTAFFALLIIFSGYLIKYKKKVNIIAGYDEQTCKDKDGLANWVGGTLIAMGILCFLFAITLIFLPNYTNLMMTAYGITIFLFALIATTGSKKYKL